MKADAVFLSYASGDRELVQRTAEGLESVGVDVWFDQRMIQPGEDWDMDIRRNINACSLFVPFISRNSVTRLEGYFRKEWRWAIDRALGMDEQFPFIHPVVIDDTRESIGGTPDYFRGRQWEWFPGGAPTGGFLDRARSLIREVRMRRAGLR